MSRRKVSTTIYIKTEQDDALKRLHVRTRVPVAEYVREAIDMLLEKYGERQLTDRDLTELEGDSR